MENTVKMHPNIQTLKDKWEQDLKNNGVHISLYEKLYYFNVLYAEACSRFHYLESHRKELKDRIYLEFKRNKEIRTDKEAEAMARTSPTHQNLIEEIRVAEKYFYQLRAEIGHLQGQMEAQKSHEISQNIEKRLNAYSGEGK